MSGAAELLARCTRLAVRVWADGDRLRCSAPPGALTPELRAELRRRRAEIVELVRRRDASAEIRPVPRDAGSVLSFAQQRLWFLAQLDASAPTYNMPAAQRLRGPLAPLAVEQSVAEIVRRHEALRTAFRLVDGRPLQFVRPLPERRGGRAGSGACIGRIDLRSLAGADQEAAVTRLAAAEARRPFDLGRGELLRVSLLCLGAESHVLLLTVHHIASDGLSNTLLIGELATLYAAFAGGRPTPLAELPVQYADFAHWQRQWLRGEVLQAHLAHWSAALARAQTVLELPADRPRPAVQRGRGASHADLLEAGLADRARELGRRRGATLFMTLLAAFAALVGRCTGQDDVLIGAPVAGRSRAELGGMIGLFANTLVLRLGLAGKPTFDELLGRARRATTAAYPFQDFPFEKLVELLQPRRDLSRNPLVQVLLNLQPGPPPALRLAGLRAQPLAVEAGTVRMDLELHVWETAAGLALQFVYDADLFDGATVQALARHLRTLLAAAVADPQARLSALPLLDAEQRQQVLVDWNRGEELPEGRHTLHRLVDARAAETPDAVAVVCADGQLTYGELVAGANRLARRLRALGVGPEVPVGLGAERSLEMVLGMLAILKAGGAYLPLDPSYPHDRLAFMLAQSGARLLLATREVAARLAGLAERAQTVELTVRAPALPRRGDRPPPDAASPGNLAYVIYTSGSTGRPKGVEICHASAASLIAAVRSRLDFGPQDVWTVCHAYSFDFSVWEIWGALASGGRLVVVPADGVRSPRALGRLLREQRVSVLHQTPSALQQLLPELSPAGRERGAPGLRWIGCGGEALPPRLATEALACGIPLWNFYGPTEATVWAALGRVSAPAAGRQSVPIGRPLANSRIHVCDRDDQAVPVGTVGELRIGGAGLARGYRRAPALTAARFTPDPFGAPGCRLYRSGDLARHRRDGSVDCQGRADHQVKLRGYRIELGEIEAALLELGAVSEAAAMVYEESAGDCRLIAYVVPAAGAPLDPEEARRHLAGKLPAYMLPAAIVPLGALPLSANGKVDRRALAALRPAQPQRPARHAGPRGETERIIAAIWAKALGIAAPGRDENFFAVGGHSLLLVEVHRELDAAVAAPLTVVDLFRYPTIRSLADRIDGAGGGAMKGAPQVELAERASRQRSAYLRQRQVVSAARKGI